MDETYKPNYEYPMREHYLPAVLWDSDSPHIRTKTSLMKLIKLKVNLRMYLPSSQLGGAVKACKARPTLFSVSWK